MPPKNSGGLTKFPGGRKVIHRTAQTAFVRVVTPRERKLPKRPSEVLRILGFPHFQLRKMFVYRRRQETPTLGFSCATRSFVGRHILSRERKRRSLKNLNRNRKTRMKPGLVHLGFSIDGLQ